MVASLVYLYEQKRTILDFLYKIWRKKTFYKKKNKLKVVKKGVKRRFDFGAKETYRYNVWIYISTMSGNLNIGVFCNQTGLALSYYTKWRLSIVIIYFCKWLLIG